MNTQQKAIKSKVGLLKLAETLGSVSQACKVMDWGTRRIKDYLAKGQTTPLRADVSIPSGGILR